jgi:hypothetical protein
LRGYHFASQWTSTIEGEYHEGDLGCHTAINVQADWLAVKGQIQAPYALPTTFDTDYDAASGWVGIAFEAGGWIQAGIYTGYIGYPSEHIQRSDYGKFVEVRWPGGQYAVYDLGSVDPGEDHRFKVMRDYPPDTDCYSLMVDYDPIATWCALPSDGVALASMEVRDDSCNLDAEECGDSVPSVPSFLIQSLHLHEWCEMYGWCWESWNESLPFGESSTYDERYSDPLTLAYYYIPLSGYRAHMRPECNPPWDVPPLDTDCDMYDDPDEHFIGTDPMLACGPYAWPSDMDDSLTVDLIDLLLLKPHFGTCDPDPGYWRRVDLDANGCVNLLDLLPFKAQFGMSC